MASKKIGRFILSLMLFAVMLTAVLPTNEFAKDKDADRAVDMAGFHIAANASTAEIIEVGGQAALIDAPGDISSGGIIKLTDAVNCGTGIAVDGKKNAVSGDKVCEINGIQYETLDAALASIPAGGTANVNLLSSMEHNTQISINGKKVTFILNGYTLNVVNTNEWQSALVVSNGGCVYLSGEGGLNVTGPARGYGVTVASNSIASEVTVTNASGIGTESKAAHAYNKASLTVLGDVTATGIGSYGVHAQSGAVVEVRGNVNAGHQGVCVSDAVARIDGNIQSNGFDMLENPEGIGVNVYDGVAEIGGNIAANRVGVMVWAGGAVTIEGTLAAPDYIQFADDAPTAIDGYLATSTKPGYRTYQQATAGTVWIKEVSLYTITVQDDGNGTADADVESAAEGAEITLTATPNDGYRFKEWQVLGGGVTISDDKFYMPGSAVTVKAVFELIPAYLVTIDGGNGGGNYAEGATVSITANAAPAGKEFDKWTTSDGVVFANENAVSTSFIMPGKAVIVTSTYKDLPPATYAIDVQDDGNGTAAADVESAAEGAEITLTATPNDGYRFKEWQVLGGGVTISDDKFHMPGSAVTVKAIFERIPDDAGYKITDGADGSWKINASDGAKIICDGDFAKFNGVKVDGSLISADNYNAVSGSTVITLKPEYLATLSAGTHIVEIAYTDGSVETKLTVLTADTENPGDNPQKKNIGLILVYVLTPIAGLGLCAIALVWFLKKRRKTK